MHTEPRAARLFLLARLSPRPGDRCRYTADTIESHLSVIELVLRMLFVPAVVLGVLVVVGCIYQKRTGKPFVAYDNGKPELWKMQPDDDIQDVVTLDELEGLWSMVSVGRNGKFAPPDVIQQSAIAIAIVADTLTVTNTLKLSTVKINSDVIPSELDQTIRGWRCASLHSQDPQWHA